MCDTEVSAAAPNKTWEDLKEVLVETSKNILKPLPVVKKKDWVSDEIIDLMTKRREIKGQDSNKYKELHKEIHQKCIAAKENWVCDICSEMETLEKKHDYFNLYKKIKTFLGNNKKITPNTLIDNSGRIMMTTQEKLKLWEKYIQTLFHDTRTDILVESSEPTAPPITKSEINYAIKCAKTRKAVGPDEIPSEVLKHIDYDNLEIVVQLFNEIYNTGCIPKDWLKSTFVTLPKISNAKKCSDFRTISLMSHMLKIFLKVIHCRINNKIEENISDTQFGFRNGLGTRDALFGFQVLMQRCWDMNQTVYICFIDYEKAFDRVQHKSSLKFFTILE
ncbi:reverse transcriptase (RNA-dependent DNA polymerase) domain-containing protein [Phthorimaea operculella]|nr:reverse transcriptase (RNA-dependent DNA polymerase) domain-containing protein [Phthorimaea operculella]